MKSSKLFFAILTLLLTFNTACFRKVVVDDTFEDIPPSGINKPSQIVKVSLQNLEVEACYQGLPESTKEMIQKAFMPSAELPAFNQLPAGEYNLISDRIYKAQFFIEDNKALVLKTASDFSQPEILPNQKFSSLGKECENTISTYDIYTNDSDLLPARFEMDENYFNWLETRKISHLFHGTHKALGSRYAESTSNMVFFETLIKKISEEQFEIYKIENYGSTHYPRFSVWVGQYVRTSTP